MSIIPLYEAQRWLQENRDVYKGATIQVPERALVLFEARSWLEMMSRCYNPDDPAFLTFGGRSIGVDGDWHLFSVFLAEMGACPQEHILTRHNVDAGYMPGNTIWSPVSQPQQLRL